MARFMVTLFAGILFLASQVGLAQEARTYQIKNRNSGKLLAVAESKTIQDDAKKGNLETWKLVKVEDYFKIIHSKSGKVLTAPPNPDKEEPGTQATLENDIGNKNQQWTLVEIKAKGMTYYMIKSRTENMVLDVDSASEDAGARVILWPLNRKGDRANQQWKLIAGK